MMQQETDRIVAHLIRRTIGEADTIAMQSLLASSVPRGIRTYFRAEVSGWISDEVGQGRRLSGIIRGTPGGTVSALLENAVLEYIFPRAEYIVTLQQAVHFLGSYLSRPQWTLRQFLTAGGAASAPTIRKHLAYVADYGYFPALIARYIESRKVESLTPGRLEALLEQIDGLVIGRGTLADLARMTRPLFEFHSLGLPDSSGIPLQPILLFLADKRLQPTMDFLERRCRTQGRSAVTLEELTALLTDREEMPGRDPSDEGARAGSQCPPEAPAEPAQSPAPPPEADAPVQRNDRNIPLSLTYAGLAEERPRAPAQPLERFIRSEQRVFFIDALFGKDSDFYAGVIDALNRLPSWNEAAGYLRELFETHGVDPLSDEALEFVEAVQMRYRAEKS